ncbi:MAG: hypothetical protein BRD52_00860 [Bacteroidetes bacterium SW_4_67_19]|nr:MAG: hypothetical protein BRD52_00860 [Bacteroidetes bacterium SW_4_67_19]
MPRGTNGRTDGSPLSIESRLPAALLRRTRCFLTGIVRPRSAQPLRVVFRCRKFFGREEGLGRGEDGALLFSSIACFMAQQGRQNDNSDKKPGASGNDGSGGGNFRFPKWLLLAAAVFLGVHLLWNWAPGGGQEVEYSRFLDQVEQGLVKEVEIVNGTSIEGAYTQDAVQSGKVEPADPGSDLLGNPASGEERRRFTTTKTDDHDLTDFLREYNQGAGASDQQVTTSPTSSASTTRAPGRAISRSPSARGRRKTGSAACSSGSSPSGYWWCCGSTLCAR